MIEINRLRSKPVLCGGVSEGRGLIGVAVEHWTMDAWI
jgi:hypothetical protein